MILISSPLKSTAIRTLPKMIGCRITLHKAGHSRAIPILSVVNPKPPVIEIENDINAWEVPQLQK